MPYERWLIWFLRATAVMLMSAAGAVVIPYAWMNAICMEIGLGTLPDLPLVAYMTRSLSALWATLGVSYWFMSRDVPRYLPLLRFAVPVTFVFEVTIIAIEVVNGMPMWWMLSGTFMFAWTAMLWWLLRRL